MRLTRSGRGLTATTVALVITMLGFAGGASSSRRDFGPQWPNEPRGFRTLVDEAWDVPLPRKWEWASDTGAVVLDPTAPGSPPRVLEVMYPRGFEGGTAPVTEAISLPNLRQIYVGLWWKPSLPWQGHPSNVNKIQFLFDKGGRDVYMAMYGPPGGPFELRVLPQFAGLPSEWYVPNVKTVPIALGNWHLIEWLLIYNTTVFPPNGILRWWLDGQLVGDYMRVPFPQQPLTDYKISPTWGGMGERKTQRDSYWYDHVRISGR